MKVLIVGAGISGAVLARELAEQGVGVSIIDKRDHLAGNCYDDNVNGVFIHKYGPHLFHTSSIKVINWVEKYSDWIPYKHKVKALLANGKFVTIPVNRETLSILGGKENVVNTLFRPYTRKMWGMSLEDVSPEIINRVPIREDDNEFYFPDDSFQALPKNGYTKFVEEILRHPLIKIELGCKFDRNKECLFDFIFNGMPIDEYFNYSLGRLPYRSLKFHHFTVPIPQILPVATVNFTHSGPFTRVTEWKLMPNSIRDPWVTQVTIEEPCDYLDNNWEPYYPVKDLRGVNILLYEMYAKLIPQNMCFIGRCGTYKYIDMDDAIDLSIKLAGKFLSKC